MLQWYAMVRHDLSTRVASSRHQVPTTDIISPRCRCWLYCRFSTPSSNMSSQPCCEIYSRISRACQRIRKHGEDCFQCFPSLGKQPISLFTAPFSLDVCKIPAYDLGGPNKRGWLEWDCSADEWLYQIRRWLGWRRQHRWAMNCRWTSWWSPMWLRWSWKLCQWTWKLKNVMFVVLKCCFRI